MFEDLLVEATVVDQSAASCRSPEGHFLDDVGIDPEAIGLAQQYEPTLRAGRRARKRCSPRPGPDEPGLRRGGGSKITYIVYDRTSPIVDADSRQTVMQAALTNSVPGIDADCGGSCGRGTCYVCVLEATGPRSASEESILDLPSRCRKALAKTRTLANGHF
jgi:ferredoxin